MKAAKSNNQHYKNHQRWYHDIVQKSDLLNIPFIRNDRETSHEYKKLKKNRGHENQKIAVVAFSDTVVDPRAVMVEDLDAILAAARQG